MVRGRAFWTQRRVGLMTRVRAFAMLPTTRRRLLALLILAIAFFLLWLRRQKKFLRGPRPSLTRLPSKALREETIVERFAAFLSHFKIEAATEARWLQQELEAVLGERCFLDSDDLMDLSRLQEHVRESNCILLLQTRSVLTRPWCLIELMTAIESRVPIVGVSITSGQSPYDFAESTHFMTHLDKLLDPDTRAKLLALGADTTDMAYLLANTLPNIISVPLNMNESRTVLSARVADIVRAMGRAALPVLPDKDKWLASRDVLAEPPQHGPANVTSPPGASAPSAAKHAAPIPAEVPTLPESAVERPDIIAALKASVVDASSSSSVTTAVGMGGVGKTIMAAALARDEEVRIAFDRICWVSVGQEPDVPALQQALHIQLLNRPMADAPDPRVALGALKEAARDLAVLVVLDDVWSASQTLPLNFVDAADKARSAVVVTTRLRSLLDGAHEIQCGVLSQEASLELLLRAGGCAHLRTEPPAAAIEAVELCGRLPLALGIAGGMIRYELADSWQVELVSLLRDELEEVSVEERVVAASLKVVSAEVSAGVEGLFALLGLFAEDATIPAVAVDVIAPLIPTAMHPAAIRTYPAISETPDQVDQVSHSRTIAGSQVAAAAPQWQPLVWIDRPRRAGARLGARLHAPPLRGIRGRFARGAARRGTAAARSL